MTYTRSELEGIFAVISAGADITTPADRPEIASALGEFRDEYLRKREEERALSLPKHSEVDTALKTLRDSSGKMLASLRALGDDRDAILYGIMVDTPNLTSADEVAGEADVREFVRLLEKFRGKVDDYVDYHKSAKRAGRPPAIDARAFLWWSLREYWVNDLRGRSRTGGSDLPSYLAKFISACSAPLMGDDEASADRIRNWLDRPTSIDIYLQKHNLA